MDKSFEEIDALRIRLGVNQAEMCRRGEVSESTISRARAAGRQPSTRIRRRLLGALQTIANERGVVPVENIDREAESHD